MKKLILLLTLTMMFGQTEVSQRVIDVTIEDQGMMTLDEIFPEYDLEWALINIVGCPINNCHLKSAGIPGYYSTHSLFNYNTYYSASANSTFFIDGYNNNILFEFDDGVTHTIKLLVTAEFPQEDTGYIEDGFDYCVEEGLNLMSYPCDSAVALTDAIPSDALSQFYSIIGEGTASVQLPNGLWAGSLIAMQTGSGYWIQSNTSLCFNYDCSEN